MKIKRRTIFLCVILFACSSDPKPCLYTKSWTLSLAEYLNTSYTLTGTAFKSALLENGLVLISEFSSAGNHLVELDLEKKSFVGNILSQNGGVVDLRERKDKNVQVTTQAANYSTGIYNYNTHAIEFFSSIPTDQILYPTNIFVIYPGDDFIYTHDPNINEFNTDTVYIAKWNFNGSRVWKKEIDPTKQFKIANIWSVQSDHVLFTSVSNFDSNTEQWKIGKITSDGTVVWNLPWNYRQILFLRENVDGDFFVLNSNLVTKFDKDGNEIWSNPLSNFTGGLLWAGRPTNDGGILLNYDAQKQNLIKLDKTGKIESQQDYWESDPGMIDFLEFSSGDFIVTTLSGNVTYYRRNW